MKWINVKDMMPDFERDVLILQWGERRKFFQKPRIGKLESIDQEGNRFKSNGEYGVNIIYDAAYWMPLPEPPKHQ